MRCKFFYLNFIIFFFLISSCNKKTEKIDTNIFNYYINSNKAIVLSCIKCGCIMDFVKNKSQDFVAKYGVKLYADFSCNDKSDINGFLNIQQNIIDSIYDRNYNLLLFRKVNDRVQMRVLRTEESEHFYEIASDFFK